MVVILFIGSDNSSKAIYSNYAYDLGRKFKLMNDEDQDVTVEECCLSGVS